ncbi:MAG TPA: hypothetical protein ENJ57_08260 [Rhizobiales bacterium]|nr:hypothetical protein [Hyphomicrobiales bacterium]
MSNSPLIKLLICGLLTGNLTACAQYLDHNEGVSLSAGNAVAHNKAVQMIDPWPRHAGRTLIPGNGERLLVGLEKYRENKIPSPESANTQGDSKSEE